MNITKSSCVCLFGVSRPTHMETSPLPMKGCKFWPILGTHDLWAVRVLERSNSLWDGGHPFNMTISENPWTHTHIRTFGIGAVTTCFNDLGLLRLGFKHSLFCSRGELSNPLRNRLGYQNLKICTVETNLQTTEWRTRWNSGYTAHPSLFLRSEKKWLRMKHGART